MILSKTPLRVSFVGGGSDLPSFCRRERGAVVSTAIARHVYVAVGPSPDRMYHVRMGHRAQRSRYLDGIRDGRVREALRFMEVTRPVWICSFASAPAGVGLGSSSSFLVGLLKAVSAWQARELPPLDLAERAAHIELDVLHEPIGRQDHYAAAMGGLNKLEFLGEKVRVTRLDPSGSVGRRLHRQMMLVRLGGTRSASVILARQCRNIENDDASFLRHRTLRDLADEMAIRISRGDLSDWPTLVHRGWLVKQHCAAGIAGPNVRRCYAAALKAGASGGKLLGAGGTGFLLVCAPPESHDRIRTAMAPLTVVPCRIDRRGSRIIKG